MTATQDTSPDKTDENYPKSSVMRKQPIIHPSSDAPLCKNCHQLDLPFFDPNCSGCMEILKSPETTIPQIFAIIRQWMPQTQQNIGLLVNEVTMFVSLMFLECLFLFNYIIYSMRMQ